jgi:hypothetical protein
MSEDDDTGPYQPDFTGWLRERDGNVHLWPMQDFSCVLTAQGRPALRIDFLYPPGHGLRSGRLQVHLSSEQARQLAAALLSAVRALENKDP